MFQAELRPAKLLKQIIEALKEVVNEVQFECSEKQMVVQAMDSSHVSLVALELNAEKFQSYRCDKPMTLGMNVGSLAKILKCAGTDDTVKLACPEDGDTLNIVFTDDHEERVSEFSMKLLSLEQDSMGIPEQVFKAMVTMPSSEFSRVCKDIANFGDTVTIDINKSGVAFSAANDIGTGRMHLKATTEIDALVATKKEGAGSPAKKEEDTKGAKEEAATKEETVVKEEPKSPDAETQKESEEAKEADEGKTTPTKDEKDVKEEATDGSAEPSAKRPRKSTAEKEKEKEKKAAEQAKKEMEKKEQKEKKEQDKEEEERRKKLLQAVRIQCDEPVNLQFALRYLTMFSKAQSVSDIVTMKLAKDTPMQMEFVIDGPSNKGDEPAPAAAQEGEGDDGRMGTLRYYLAPKVGDDDADAAEAPAANDE